MAVVSELMGVKGYGRKVRTSASAGPSVAPSPSSPTSSRLLTEIKSFLSSPPPGLSLSVSRSNVRVWIVTYKNFTNTFANETHRLKLTFPHNYPSSPPSAYFLKPIPKHEHVYQNGDICLSLLGSDWSPTLTSQGLCIAIQSMLNSAVVKRRPRDDAGSAGRKPGGKQEDWVYHDDSC
jgi:ubiquitin-conjugating enzyme E2 W